MHSITVVHTIHIIVGLDARPDHSPCLDGTHCVYREALPFRAPSHYPTSRLWKQHDSFCPGSGVIFYFRLEKGHRINRFTGSGLHHIQMQMRAEWITGITAPGYLLPGLHRIFTRLGNNLDFPILFFILQFLHSPGNIGHETAQVPVDCRITVVIHHIEYMSRPIGDANTGNISVGERTYRFANDTLSLEIEPSMKMVSPDFSEVAAQSQCKVKWRNKSSLLHILWMSLNAAGKHQGNYILFHVVCLKMESLQKYIIPAILENRRVDFIPIRHPTIILL